MVPVGNSGFQLCAWGWMLICFVVCVVVDGGAPVFECYMLLITEMALRRV